MIDSANFTPEPHPFVEGEDKKHLREVLKDYVIPAFHHIEEDMEARGASIGEIRTVLFPTLIVSGVMTLGDGTRINVRVSWIRYGTLGIFFTGTDELSWNTPNDIVTYKPGDHLHLAHAFRKVLVAFVAKANNPSWYYNGKPSRLYA